MRFAKLASVIAVIVCLGWGVAAVAEPVLQSEMPGFDIGPVHVNGGAIAIILTMLWIYGSFKKAFGPSLKKWAEFREEHDILWEEYNIRNDGKWRRRAGRGGAIALHVVPSEERSGSD